VRRSREECRSCRFPSACTSADTSLFRVSIQVHLFVEFLSEFKLLLSFACKIIVRPCDGCSSLKARVVDGVGARVVIDSIDMVSGLEVTVVCIPSKRSAGVGGRW